MAVVENVSAGPGRGCLFRFHGRIPEPYSFAFLGGVARHHSLVRSHAGRLEPGAAGEVGHNHFTPDYINCCDAGHGFFQDYPIPFLWGARMARSFESVFRKAGNATQNRLHLLDASGKLKGFVLSYLGQLDNRVPEVHRLYSRNWRDLEYRLRCTGRETGHAVFAGLWRSAGQCTSAAGRTQCPKAH
jgi:hypothetical protein